MQAPRHCPRAGGVSAGYHAPAHQLLCELLLTHPAIQQTPTELPLRPRRASHARLPVSGLQGGSALLGLVHAAPPSRFLGLSSPCLGSPYTHPQAEGATCCLEGLFQIYYVLYQHCVVNTPVKTVITCLLGTARLPFLAPLSPLLGWAARWPPSSSSSSLSGLFTNPAGSSKPWPPATMSLLSPPPLCPCPQRLPQPRCPRGASGAGSRWPLPAVASPSSLRVRGEGVWGTQAVEH